MIRTTLRLSADTNNCVLSSGRDFHVAVGADCSPETADFTKALAARWNANADALAALGDKEEITRADAKKAREILRSALTA